MKVFDRIEVATVLFQYSPDITREFPKEVQLS